MTAATAVEFTRDVRFEKGYDKRDQPRGGAHSMGIRFILRGPRGAVTALVMTGWMVNPLTRPLTYGIERRPGVGVDAGVGDVYPSGTAITCHSAEKVRDWWMGPDDCDILEGGRCYGDTGYTVADTFLERLVGDGEDAAWAYLTEVYEDWFAPEAVDA